MIVDIDATLVTAHPDKEGAEPTFKRGYGFAPMRAFVDHGEHGTCASSNPMEYSKPASVRAHIGASRQHCESSTVRRRERLECRRTHRSRWRRRVASSEGDHQRLQSQRDRRTLAYDRAHLNTYGDHAEAATCALATRIITDRIPTDLGQPDQDVVVGEPRQRPVVG